MRIEVLHDSRSWRHKHKHDAVGGSQRDDGSATPRLQQDPQKKTGKLKPEVIVEKKALSHYSLLSSSGSSRGAAAGRQLVPSVPLPGAQ